MSDDEFDIDLPDAEPDIGLPDAASDTGLPAAEPDEAPEPIAPTPLGDRTGVPWGLGLFLVLSVLLVIFAIQNTQTVTLRFLPWEGRFPLAVVVVAIVVVTVILDEVLGALMRRRRRRRRAERAELDRLRSMRR